MEKDYRADKVRGGKEHKGRTTSTGRIWGKQPSSGQTGMLWLSQPGSTFEGERTKPCVVSTLHRPHSYNRGNQFHSSLGSCIPKLSRKPEARQELEAAGEGSPVWKTWKVTESGSQFGASHSTQYPNITESTCTSSEMLLPYLSSLSPT